ncbi:radical SAM family heme chaperone HemW [soil metagenome]
MHLPWCVQKCPYCDFNSHVRRGKLPESHYIDALLDDLDLDLAEHADPRPLESIFLGGGTPSLIAPAAISRLLDGIGSRLHRRPAMEVTLEANPGTVERGRFAEYRAAGITRLSIGAQSFCDRSLQALGRIHRAAETFAAMAEARAASFADVNLDVMYGLPVQTVEEALADIRTALGLEPSHLSHYELTIEPNTRFYSRPPALPDEDARTAMHEASARLIADAGFEHYEVSAYAQPGRRCRHNDNYWAFGDYLGIGAGAHAKLTDARADRILRTAKLRHPLMYLRHANGHQRIASRREVRSDERTFEFMLNALRLPTGFSRELFEERVGLNLDVVAPRLEQARERELLVRRGDGGWRPTRQGFRFLNDLQALFLPEAPRERRSHRRSGGEDSREIGSYHE